MLCHSPMCMVGGMYLENRNAKLPQSTLVPLRCFSFGLRRSVQVKNSLLIMRQIPGMNRMKQHSVYRTQQHVVIAIIHGSPREFACEHSNM